MGWVKLDDGYRNHPKMTSVGAEGVALDIAGLCYAAAYLTDGFIPDSAVRTLYPVRNTTKTIAALVSVGRWERDNTHGGYWIHDYLDYQPPADKVLADREKEREKKRQQRRNPDGTYGTVPPVVPQGHMGGVPEGVPTVPSRPVPSSPPVLTSVGKSSSSESVATDDESPPVLNEAVRLIAERKVNAQTGVRSRSRYLARTTEKTIAEMGEDIARWLHDDPTRTAQAACDFFEPVSAPAHRETAAEQAARLGYA